MLYFFAREVWYIADVSRIRESKQSKRNQCLTDGPVFDN